MSRVIWKENKIVSIKLRNGKYALLQMLKRKGYVAVFNKFSEDDKWDGITLNEKDVLIMTFIMSGRIFPNSEVKTQKQVKPVANLEYPRFHISLGDGSNSRIKVWSDTPEEKEVIVDGYLNLFLIERISEDPWIEKDSPINVSDYDKFKHLGTTSLGNYPEFNEKLYIWSELGKYYEPEVELAFGHELHPICKCYVAILTGELTIGLNDYNY